MKVLDLDMDYFLKADISWINESESARLDNSEYSNKVWSEEEVISFFENNLKLSKNNKIPGRVVTHHNEALVFWQELISRKLLISPFEVIHIDSHADLGLGYSSWVHIINEMLKYPVEERPQHSKYKELEVDVDIGIGDYLLYAIAYRLLSHLTYCGNPYRDCNDYIVYTLKGFKENLVFRAGNPVYNTIQLYYNPIDFPITDITDNELSIYLKHSRKEPEVPFYIIPRIEDVKFEGDYDFVTLAQSPNYTPQCADYIMDLFRKYIVEI